MTPTCECLIFVEREAERKFAGINWDLVEEVGPDPSSMSVVYKCRNCPTYFALGPGQRVPDILTPEMLAQFLKRKP